MPAGSNLGGVAPQSMIVTSNLAKSTLHELADHLGHSKRTFVSSKHELARRDGTIEAAYEVGLKTTSSISGQPAWVRSEMLLPTSSGSALRFAAISFCKPRSEADQSWFS